MVNPEYLAYFGSHLHKDLEGNLAGPPTIVPGGVSLDHYKGLSASVASRVIPFAGQTYEASEYLYGWIPLTNPAMPYLYFQCAVLDVKGKNIPGNMQAATWVRAPIPSTIITPLVGLTHRYLPMSAFEQGEARTKDVFKNKVGWNAVLEALNADKAATKASTPGNYSTEMTQMGLGATTYKVQVHSGSPLGLTQLAPYRGFTVITQQRPPASNAGINKPRYAFDEVAQKFSAIAEIVHRHPQPGEEIGEQMISDMNAAAMDLLYKQIDQSAEPAPAPAAASAPAAERVPCPTCSALIGIGWNFCPNCQTPLVWQ